MARAQVCQNLIISERLVKQRLAYVKPIDNPNVAKRGWRRKFGVEFPLVDAADIHGL